MRNNVLSGLALDRAGGLRTDPSWIADAWRHPEVRVVPVWRSQHIVSPHQTPELVFVGSDRFDELAEPIFLGQDEATSYFAVDVSHVEEPLGHLELADVHRLMSLRELAALLPREDAALLAYANGMMSWHRRHRFCGRCGGTTATSEGGHVRRCGGCDEQHFPRTDPAVIMLVTDGDRCLLGRQSSWPEKVYSTLAGFVEPGESVEEAVCREVWEESGIRVVDVRYHSSQPWPFPSSLMLGFTARAETRDIQPKMDELEDARWFRRDELVASKEVKLPSAISIARRLIEDWLSAPGPRAD